jgi:hypothetical protein
MTAILLPIVAVLSGATAGATVLPQLPDVAPLAALIDRPSLDCNAADRFLEAEEIYRQGELQKPVEERTPLPLDHPAMTLVLDGLECRRCEFPYSADIAIPPTEQRIPMAALYSAASAGLVEHSRELREKGDVDRARQELGRALQLGLLLFEEPGITFIQHLIALRVLADAAEGLGDLAIARGDEEVAATCARFLARTNAYSDDLGVWWREFMAYPALQEDPAGHASVVRKLAPFFDATSNLALQLEILVYLGLAQAVLDPSPAREAAVATLERARRSPDRRIGKVAEWALGLEAEEAVRTLGHLAGPAPRE